MALARIRIFAEMIKFEHTVFALPFAYLGAFLAKHGVPSGRQILWITLAMVGARTAAMALNRLIDRHIDARNPRTAARAIPKGLLSEAEVLFYIAASWALLLVAAWQLNPLNLAIPLTVKLMPIAVIVLTVYSYTKRFTWMCHFVLGLSLGLAPVGSWVGITGKLEFPSILIGLTVLTWVAGFDVIYACQDYDFDRREGIYSIPAVFGIKTALVSSALLHVITFIFLVWIGIITGLGYFYWLGVIAAAGILIYEHSLVTPTDLSRLDAAFFSMNGILSVMLFIFTFADILFGRGISL
ncbi:MAG: 4-hydroxybenzoate octaprenyltransferase [Firmicutes bacterium HGW-Firmicutes-14]|nr:MAG: 4-hydroxybenzoate octaprenyltransferase [Firmicutes bacterium HGW-Firmicutes-14]